MYIVFLPKGERSRPLNQTPVWRILSGSSGPSHEQYNTYKEKKMADSSLAGIAKLSAGWAIALSVLLILAGILAIVVPPAAGIGVAIVVAWLVLLGGIAH